MQYELYKVTESNSGLVFIKLIFISRDTMFLIDDI